MSNINEAKAWMNVKKFSQKEWLPKAAWLWNIYCATRDSEAPPTWNNKFDNFVHAPASKFTRISIPSIDLSETFSLDAPVFLNENTVVVKIGLSNTDKDILEAIKSIIHKYRARKPIRTNHFNLLSDNNVIPYIYLLAKYGKNAFLHSEYADILFPDDIDGVGVDKFRKSTKPLAEQHIEWCDNNKLNWIHKDYNDWLD